MNEIEEKLVPVGFIAELLGYSATRIHQLRNDGILVSKKVQGFRGQLYPLLENITRYIKYLEDKKDNENIISVEVKKTTLKKKQLELKQLERKVIQEEKNLHDAEILKAVWNDVMLHFANCLNKLPERATNLVFGLNNSDEISEKLRQVIYETCEEMANYNPDDFYNRNPDYNK